MAAAQSVTSWTEWLTGLARSSGSAAAGALSEELRFPTADGLVIVREELGLEHLGGSVSRARCPTSGIEFDLRRLRVGAEEGGLVALEALEAVDREADLATRAGQHPNVLRCHGVLVQNAGATHSRLLLCDACTFDLAAHLADGDLPVGEVADLGQQLAFGLGHLHSCGILCGGLSAQGILRGLDGFWKLADFRRAALLPVAASQWREMSRSRPQESPLEARGCTDDALKPEADVWLLGSLLSKLLAGAGLAMEGAALPPQRLTEPLVARLWLLLHWLLADTAESRPCAGESAALLGAVLHTPPHELLEEMPATERRRCCAVAAAAARQLAIDLAPGSSWRLFELPLERLKEELADSRPFDLLLENCGVDLHALSEAAEEEDQGPLTEGFDIGFSTSKKVLNSDVSTSASSMSDESGRADEGCFATKSACDETCKPETTDLLGLG